MFLEYVFVLASVEKMSNVTAIFIKEVKFDTALTLVQ